ncbi:hypothetical protein BC937DRAFT_92532 [Endogone sp. FLAS-F59071]|nr:hypothetical protein BC937DRAFT_92532 [Endogone sp. FLAS-F59071]|eukprot:RUS15382.1 hypothetical protein BC937DRAFT_92532 [Endogone sp. FLAS-F59071]
METDTTISPWFTGSVADAVGQATLRNCVFLVYIHDNSVESQQMDAVLSGPTLALLLRDETIALRLERVSEEAAMFAQLCKYPCFVSLTRSPSSDQSSPKYIHDKPVNPFFLSCPFRAGALRDFAPGVLTEEDVMARIVRAATDFPTLLPPTASATLSPSVPTPTAQVAPPAPSPSPSAPVAETASASSSQPVAALAAESLSSANRATADDKKERLKKQLEERRKKREEEEKERERELETRRRADGHAVQQLQRDLSEKQNKKLAEEYKKEKREADEARRKIREQIALDRADRAARRAAEFEERRRAAGEDDDDDDEEEMGGSSKARARARAGVM